MGSEQVTTESKKLTQNAIFTYTDKAPITGVNISGNVLDAQTGIPVPFANVVYCQYNPW